MQQQKLAILKRDITINTISRCGKFRITAVSAPNILKEAVRRHKLSNSSTKFKWNPTTAIPLLGQVICFSNLTASWLSHEERVKTSFSTIQNGTFVSQSLALGETVCYIANRPVKVENQQENETSAYEYDEDLVMSNGVLKVERIMYRHTTPILSATKWIPSAEEQKVVFKDHLDDENMNDALAPHVMNFFGRSDGVPTAAFFFSHYDENNLDQVYNGGVFVQAVAASAAEVEDPKNDFEEGISNPEKNPSGKKLTAERELEQFILDRCDVFSQLASTIDHEKQVVNYSYKRDGDDISAVFLNQLHRRATQGLLMQDLIGFATNDWNGAAKVCNKARHLTQKDLEADNTIEWPADIVMTPELAMLAEKCFGKVTREIEEERKSEEEKETDENKEQQVTTSIPNKRDPTKLRRIRLDIENVQRTAIDFYCRCQKSKSFENFLKNSFKTSEDAIKFLKENPQEGSDAAAAVTPSSSSTGYHYSCASCGAENVVTDEDVMKMFIENDNNTTTSPASQ